MVSLVEDLTKYRRGKEWLSKNIELLKEAYRGKYIAVLGDRIVDQDEDGHILIRRLWSRGLYPGPIIIKFIE